MYNMPDWGYGTVVSLTNNNSVLRIFGQIGTLAVDCGMCTVSTMLKHQRFPGWASRSVGDLVLSSSAFFYRALKSLEIAFDSQPHIKTLLTLLRICTEFSGHLSPPA